MTINEIQSTLDQLKERHPELNEGLVSTLLEAGGWDKNNIEEALMLFKSGAPSVSLPHKDEVALPQPAELLLSQHNSTPVDEISTKEQIPTNDVVEKQPLAPSKEEIKPVVTEEKFIPHELPVKPFGASPHVWPFSKYKEVFHGDVMPSEAPKKEEQSKTEMQVEKIIEKPKEVKEELKTEPTNVIAQENDHLTGEDESLIALALLLLFVVVLLAIYMYINGRL